MSGPFQVGDVVVCIVAADGREKWEPQKNAVYRVAGVNRNGDIDLEEDPFKFPPDEFAWEKDEFRHLPRATEEFTAQMRALRPLKVEEPA